MKPQKLNLGEFFVDSIFFLKYQVHLRLIVSDSSSTLIDDLGAKIARNSRQKHQRFFWGDKYAPEREHCLQTIFPVDSPKSQYGPNFGFW